ncbi:hypothetical protein CBS101457_001281 [Exobasidium rhododendri]|nr:hypothetical protein CBS101457_001281 [Exobasidium rhododendri]
MNEATAPIAPSVPTTGSSAPAERHLTHESAHHLKWGEIQVSGFAPDATNDGGLSDVDGDGDSLTTRNREDRRRKMTKNRSEELLHAEARRIQSKRRYLYRKPRALQYFRGSILVRSNDERSSGRLELFFDLTFVGIIAVLAEEVIEEPTGASLVRYLITYTAAYLVWQWMREIFNAFYKDDLSQKILVLFVVACLVIYGNNAPQAQQNLSQGPARAAAIGSYLLAEFSLFASFFYYSFHVKPYRAQLRAHSFAWLLSSAIWIACIFVDVKSAIIMAVFALAFEYGAWLFCYTIAFKKLFRLRYSSALNIEHEIERFNDFFTLVIGEFLYSIVSRSPARLGVHIAAGRAILAVIIAFCFQLLYMQGAGSNRITHPIRYKWLNGILYFTLHLPLVSAMTLCGDSMADLVRDEHVSNSIRWIACETYAISMIALWSLAMIEHERDARGELWLPKLARLAPRLIAGVVAIFLPFTHQGSNRGIDINTTRLLGILAALSFFTILWEHVTCLDGPNAVEECANEDFLSKADDGHTPKAALSTPKWRGFPTLVEPGSGSFDRTHQRERRTTASDGKDIVHTESLET